MEQVKRIEYFNDIINQGAPIGSMDLWYKQNRRTFSVYNISLKFLIYNRFNGRIASLVKSYEKETGHELDPTDRDDIKIIEKFLWQSNEGSNKATESSIHDQGQLKYGIVTKDGVIIDGNRRAMILRKVYDEEPEVYFRAVVLDEALADNPREIMRLETTYQMGEDAKVDYNPIEKYLKVKDMLETGFTCKDVGKAMGEPESIIQEYQQIMSLMDEYLEGMSHQLLKLQGDLRSMFDVVYYI